MICVTKLGSRWGEAVMQASLLMTMNKAWEVRTMGTVVLCEISDKGKVPTK